MRVYLITFFCVLYLNICAQTNEFKFKEVRYGKVDYIIVNIDTNNQVINGEYQFFSDSKFKKLCEYGNIINGLRDGVWYELKGNGHYIETNYFKGIEHGSQRIILDNKIIAKFEIKYGQYVSIDSLLTSDGYTSIIDIPNDSSYGIALFNHKGYVTDSIVFNNGEILRRKKYSSKKANLLSIEEFDSTTGNLSYKWLGYKHGEIEEFYEQSGAMNCLKYYKGKLILKLSYDISGILKSETIYRNNKEPFSITYFKKDGTYETKLLSGLKSNKNQPIK